ncbi:MAG: hypothetical protein IPG32_13580 [Saprospirales bacterium]|nr:hypothetical protein [Saprospirales bacterium]
MENSQVLEYELYRVLNGTPQLEAVLDPTQTSYTDEVDLENSLPRLRFAITSWRGAGFCPRGSIRPS